MPASRKPSTSEKEKPSGNGGVKQLRAELAKEKAAREKLERALLEAATKEQARLAQTLHDTVCQSFSGIYLMTRVAVRKLQKTNPDAARDVEELGEMIHKSVGELHDLTTWLRPSQSTDMDLGAALAELAGTASQKVKCQLHVPERVVLADRFAAVQVFQIAHEAVSAAIYRSGATEVTITLTRDKSGVMMQIRDNGGGGGERRTGRNVSAFELLSHRATVIGAALEVFSPPQGGTTISCRIPAPN